MDLGGGLHIPIPGIIAIVGLLVVLIAAGAFRR